MCSEDLAGVTSEVLVQKVKEPAEVRGQHRPLNGAPSRAGERSAADFRGWGRCIRTAADCEAVPFDLEDPGRFRPARELVPYWQTRGEAWVKSCGEFPTELLPGGGCTMPEILRHRNSSGW